MWWIIGIIAALAIIIYIAEEINTELNAVISLAYMLHGYHTMQKPSILPSFTHAPHPIGKLDGNREHEQD